MDAVDSFVYSVALDPVPSSVAAARLMLRAALWDWQLDHLADAAQLIISELASNSIKFAANVEAAVYLRGSGSASDGDTLVIEVTDDSQELPSVLNACPDDESYRGMFLVETLASKWGVELLDCGKLVWAHLDFAGTDNHRERQSTTPAAPASDQG